MTTDLTLSAIIGQAKKTLEDNGYRVVRTSELQLTIHEFSLLAEDQFAIVAVSAYETVKELVDRWADIQADLVHYFDKRLSRADPKLWECYLILLSPSTPSSSQKDKIEQIRYDTREIRKIIVTGHDLETTKDVSDALLPVLPMEKIESLAENKSDLEELPFILAQHGADPESVRIVVRAFDQQGSIMQELHEHLGGHANK